MSLLLPSPSQLNSLLALGSLHDIHNPSRNKAKPSNMRSNNILFPHGPRDLTVGIEFEFLVLPPQNPVGIGDSAYSYARDTRNKRAQRLIIQDILRETDLPVAAACGHTWAEVCPACEGVPDAQSHCMTPKTTISVHSNRNTAAIQGMHPSTRFFTFVTEYLSRNVKGSSGFWEGMEVTSPVLTSRGELARGMPSVRKFIRGLREGQTPIAINDTCGLHVHAGYGEGMTLLRAKKIVSLVMLLEQPLLLPFCAPSRLGGMYCSAVSSHSCLADMDAEYEAAYRSAAEAGEERKTLENNREFEAHIPAPAFFSRNRWNHNNAVGIYNAIVSVWACHSLMQLQTRLMCDMDQRGGLALCLRQTHGAHLDDGHDGSPSTVEFRYLQGTLDEKLLVHWVGVIEAILQNASLDAVGFHALLKAILETLGNGRRVVWSEMLGQLGIGGQTSFWVAQMMKYKTQEEFSDEKDFILQKGQ